MRRTALISLLLVVLGAAPIFSQPIGVGFYDVDRLYDTIPSLFYNDGDFTPSGRNKWDSERYERKVAHIAQVVDSMALPILGLFGIESEEVVRDLIAQCESDYCYIHRTRNSLDGMDFALLYFGDVFVCEEVEDQRNLLIVEGELLHNSQPLRVVLSRNGDDAVDLIEDLSDDRLTIVLGSIYHDQISEVGYHNPLLSWENRGRGNYMSYRGWMMYDRVAVRDKEKILKSGVYITKWLLTYDGQSPLATLDKEGYKGGYSRYLPIYTYIR